MKRLVLVGPGHAHLAVLERLARAPVRGVEPVLVSLGPRQPYSGMLPGLLAGAYREQEVHVELRGLCRAAGARLEESGAAVLDAHARTVRLGSGQVLAWDVASVDVGALSSGDALPGVREHAVTLKPLSRALARLQTLGPGGDPLLVVGGGAAGVELALCLAGRFDVTLLERGELVPRGTSRALQRRVARALARRGVRVRTGVAVERLHAGAAVLAGGERVPFGACLWATGPRPSPLLAACGAALDADGFLAVRATLESESHPGLFAAGDCAGLPFSRGVPKSGVYAVREGPVLWHNLRARLAGEPRLRRFRPQRGALMLLNAGDGRALGAWRGLAFEGAWALALKDRIDRRFVGRYARLAARA